MKARKRNLLPFVVIGILVELAIPLGFAQATSLQEPIPVLELTILDCARVVDHDGGIYVVGTSGGDLYVMNEAGDYTVTALGAGSINDVRIENGFIAVAAGKIVIELELDGLTPEELWRTTDSNWRVVVSTDLSDDGNYVCYLARRYPYYSYGGEIGVLGGGGGGSLISRLYTHGYSPTNFWIDATGDMEYIAASHPTYPPYYRVGVGYYSFNDSTLTFQWWTDLIHEYDVTEVRVSENKDWVAAATSCGTYMKLLRTSDGAIRGSHNTPNKEQFACDGDDNLNYVIGANHRWSPPYGWFILKNLGESGFEVVDDGTMSGAINDLDANPDASLLAFGSDGGEFLLLSRSDDDIETVFDDDVDKFIDAIEIGHRTLLVGGCNFINLYGFVIEVAVDIKPGSWPNAINLKSNGVIPVAILTTSIFDGESVDFDATTVDPLSVEFGPAGATEVHEQGHIEDVDEDGDLDMVLHFKTKETGIQAGDSVACLTGETVDGRLIKGCDAIVTVPHSGSKSVAQNTTNNTIPNTFSVSQNRPNPVSSKTSISYAVPKSSHVTLDIYNAIGQLVNTLVNRTFGPGYYTAMWDGKDRLGNQVPNGIYYYKLTAGDFTEAKKMILMR